MGCSFSKMGSGVSTGSVADAKTKPGPSNSIDPAVPALPEPPPPAPTDPRLPLNAQQRFKISKSWKGIARAMDYTGVNMFVKLFEDHEELLTLFTKFGELKTKETQMESLELQQHATIVMQTLDRGIRELDNVDVFLDFLQEVGCSHRKIPGFKKEYFWKIKKPFLTAVKETLGDRYNENMESIYTITIQFIVETLIKGFERDEIKQSMTA